MKDWLQDLNPEQAEAVLHNDGPLLILAGAGSGKTTVLVARTGRLISEKKTTPERICVLTFTNKAATELKHRVARRLGDRAKKVWAGTFHSFGLKFLKEYWKEAGLPKKFGVIDSGDSTAILKDLAKNIKDYEKAQLNLELLANKIAWIRQHGKEPVLDGSPEAAAAIVFAPRYQRRLRELGVVDFEELLLRPLKMMNDSTELKAKVQKRFDYIMVDEFQDTNSTQMKLVDLLSQTHGNLAVVGDDDQSIYGWRGAEIQNILQFPKRYKQCCVIRLERNYRSSETILKLANEVIANNKMRHGKVLKPGRPNPGQLPELFVFENEENEVDETLRELQNFYKQGYTWRDMAILYRSNSQGGLMEGGLRRLQIPYKLSGGTALFDRKEAKDVLAYLRCMFYPSEVAFRRILNVPARGIGEKTLDEIELIEDGEFFKKTKVWAQKNLQEKAGQGIIELFEFLQNLKKTLVYSSEGAEEILDREMTKLGYRHLVNQSYKDLQAAEGRWLSVVILGRILEGMFKKHGRTEDTLEMFVDSMELRDVGDDDGDNPPDEVQMMTLHACKGLEFPLVFLLGVEEDLLPHARLGQNTDEERRLFYVGITRAQKHLILSRVQQRKRYGKLQDVAPSRFLLEVDSKLYTEMIGARPLAEGQKTQMLADLLKKLDQKKIEKEIT
jgi:DNA helicase-2/ATP-dependent DNA helicase PcrA